MTASTFTWRKSSRSAAQSGNCIETAAAGRSVAVRDSKNPDGGQLRVSGTAWQAFARRVRSS